MLWALAKSSASVLGTEDIIVLKVDGQLRE